MVLLMLSAGSFAGYLAAASSRQRLFTIPLLLGLGGTTKTVPYGAVATLAPVFSGGTGNIVDGTTAVVAAGVTSGNTYPMGPLASSQAYTLQVTNLAGDQVTGTVTVTVTPPLVDPIAPASSTVTAGTTVIFSSFVTNALNTGLTWSATGGSWVGSTWTAPGTPGSYTVYATAAADGSTRQSATVTVVAAPVATSLVPSTTAPLYGAAVTLTPTFANGVGVIGATGIGSSDLTASATTGSGVGSPALTSAKTYTLTVTNTAGTQATASSGVITPQTVAVSAVLPANQTKTVGTAGLVFTSSVSGAVNAAITWSVSAGSITAGQGTNSMTWTAPVGAQTATITATSAADGSKAASTSVFVVAASAQPVVTAPAYVTSAHGGYTASVGTQAGCSYSWSLSSGTLTGGQGTNAITWTAPASGTVTLTCSVTDGGGTVNSGNATSAVVAVPTASLSGTPNPVPKGGRTSLKPVFTGGTGSINFSIGTVVSGSSYWSGTLNSPNTYILTVTNLAGTQATASLTITVMTPSMGAIQATDAIPPCGKLENLSVQITGVFDQACTWVVTGPGGGGTIVTDVDTWCSYGRWLIPPLEGTYTVTATSNVDNSLVATKTFTVAWPAFTQNSAGGGYDTGLYPPLAEYPTAFNWDRSSRWLAPATVPGVAWTFNTGDIGDLVIDQNGCIKAVGRDTGGNGWYKSLRLTDGLEQWSKPETRNGLGRIVLTGSGAMLGFSLGDTAKPSLEYRDTSGNLITSYAAGYSVAGELIPDSSNSLWSAIFGAGIAKSKFVKYNLTNGSAATLGNLSFYNLVGASQNGLWGYGGGDFALAGEQYDYSGTKVADNTLSYDGTGLTPPTFGPDVNYTFSYGYSHSLVHGALGYLNYFPSSPYEVLDTGVGALDSSGMLYTVMSYMDEAQGINRNWLTCVDVLGGYYDPGSIAWAYSIGVPQLPAGGINLALPGLGGVMQQCLSPILDVRGNIVVGNGDKVYCFSSAGDLLWLKDLGLGATWWQPRPVALAKDGSIVVNLRRGADMNVVDAGKIIVLR
jgi:hypothetical protein